jgi:lipoate-protein ligase A
LSSGPLFDVDPFREEPRRIARAREVPGPTLVLGSTQAADVVVPVSGRRRSVEVVRRRSGGGAVYLHPGEQVWIDAWVPRDDPLWEADVSKAADWVGAWWASALGALGLAGLEVHSGRAVPGELGALVCFAGRGPGEVFWSGRKIMGLAQWRSREGALFSACTYRHWDPAPLLDLVEIEADLVDALGSAAVGLGDLNPDLISLASLEDALLSSLSDWGTQGQ